MDVKSNTDKVCIIGAGSSGLAAAKTFAERGTPFECGGAVSDRCKNR